MVREFIDALPKGTRVMFDGFARAVAQAEALEALLAQRGRSIGRVLLLDVPRDELVRRILARSRSEGRADDTPEVIARRFDVYAEQTQPVVEHYEQVGRVRRVDGLGDVDVVTAELDRIAADVLARAGAKSSFLGYYGYPATICTSVNEQIVHGIPGKRKLKEGDIVGIDAGAIVDGWHADAAITVPVGRISAQAE